MPATAGRVRMPHNNRMSVSASLKTTGIWAQTIGHDPYAGQGDDGDGKKHLDPDNEKQLLDAAKKQSVADGIMRDDFARKMYKGLKGGKKRRGMVDEEAEAKARERQELLKVLDEEESSSEDEEEYEKVRSKDKKKKKEKKRKKEKRKSKRKRKYSSSESDDDSSDDDDSDSSESSHKRRRKHKKKKKSKHRSKHRKKERKRSHHSSSEDDDDDESSDDDDSRRHSKSRRRRRESRKKDSKKDSSELKDGSENQDAFIPSETFAGSKEGYVFRDGDQGQGYYLDNTPAVDQERLRQQLQRFTD